LRFDQAPGEPRRRNPCHRAAEAVADDADVSGPGRLRDRRLHVEQGLLPVELLHQLDAGLDLRLRVAGFVAAANAVEERGREHAIAVGRIAVGDRPDVAVHAEDLLNHHHAAARLARGLGEPGTERMSVGSLEFDHPAHRAPPRSRQDDCIESPA